MLKQEKQEKMKADVSVISGQIAKSALLENKLDGKNDMKSKQSVIIMGVYGLLILLGIGTGYVLAQRSETSVSLGSKKIEVVNTGKVAGVTDTKTFKDSAEGVLEKGGIEAEGSHKLIREGGPSQTAYLVSSVVDLDKYVGKKVRVWGETFAARKASWLLDVGKIQVLE